MTTTSEPGRGRFPAPSIITIVVSMVVIAYLLGGLFGVDNGQAQISGAGMSLPPMGEIPLPPAGPMPLTASNAHSISTPVVSTSDSMASPSERMGLEVNPGAKGQGRVTLAVPTVHYLHATDAQVGSITYNIANTTAPTAGTASTAANAATRNTWLSFVDGAAISIWVSDPVPTGTSWAIGGSWNFSIYARTQSSDRFWFRARIYRVYSNGTTALIATTGQSARYDVGTSYNLNSSPFTWNYTLAANTINTGERLGIEIQSYNDGGNTSSVTLGFDSTGQNSRFTVPDAMPQPSSNVREARFRVGRDTPLSSMAWQSATDATGIAIPRNIGFRVRFQLYNDGAAPVSWQPRLEWSATSAAGYAAVPTTPSGVPFVITDTVHFTNSASIAAGYFGLGTGTGAAQPGYAYDAQNPASAITLNANSYTEIEFNVLAGDAAAYNTSYYFRLTNNGAPLTSYANEAIVRIETSGDLYYLHAYDATAGAGVHNTVNTAAVAGALVTATAPLDTGATEAFADAQGRSIFVSDPVPNGYVWDISGMWNFNAYVRGSAATQVYMRATLYTIATDDTLLWLDYAIDNTARDITTAYGLLPWSFTLASGTVINPGQRFGVEIAVRAAGAALPGQTATLGFDEASAPTSVVARKVENSTTPSVREAHFRIGNDTALNAMTWRASTDSAASGVPRAANFRVRFQVYNNGSSGKSWRPQLEWSTSSGSGYSATPNSSGAAPFFVADTAQYSDASTISSNYFALGSGAGLAQDGYAFDTQNPAPASTLNANSFTEIEFNIRANSNAAYSTPYYFRLTDIGAPFASYINEAIVIMESGSGSPTPTPAPPAHAHDPNGYGVATDACSGCHRLHQAVGQPLQKSQPEESVCFSCHDGTNPPAPNIKAQFQKAYKMPIAGAAGVHTPGEARTRTSASFNGPNRHIECVDCHNPHKAGASTHIPGTNYASSVFQDQWGIAVSNVVSWTAPVFTPISPVRYEYEVCLKCHSSWAYGANPPASPSGGFPETDQSKEFNTLNPAYHPVQAPGKNPFVGRFGSYASSLIGGFSPTSTMYCSDCHRSETASDPKGPHGSTQPFILRGAWNRNTGSPGSSNHLCFNCHNFNVYADENNENNPSQTGFSSDRKNLHAFMVGKRGKVCMDCHIAVPHGWQRDHLLGYNDDPAPYINRTGDGLQRVNTWRSPGYWTQDSCGTAGDCH